ncbi:MAG: hypothetical protein HY048_03980 [Acidobacteria bacterium]|nr:hypothetical protein [Acidobacteriota bacterium]
MATVAIAVAIVLAVILVAREMYWSRAVGELRGRLDTARAHARRRGSRQRRPARVRSLEVEHSTGHGFRFHVELPVAAAGVDSREPAATSGQPMKM